MLCCSQCTKIVLPLLTSYFETMKVLDVVDHVLAGPPGGTHDVQPNNLTASQCQSGVSWERAVAIASGTPSYRAGSSGGSSGLSATASSGPSSSGSKHGAAAGAGTPVDEDALMAKVDEIADQLSFLCKMLENYLRTVTVSLLLGLEEQGSQLRCAVV